MGLHLHDVGVLTVKQGQNASNFYAIQAALGSIAAGGIDIFTPAYQTETFALQVSPVRVPQSTDWFIMQWQPGQDALLPAQRGVSIPFAGGMRAIRVFCTSGNALADRVFRIILQVVSEGEVD